ncbi:MAG TPA: MoxR family ATPase [Bacteroidia bacterium]|nr:MoxR family ATPase [Bacteroidia bacterium]
MEPTQDSNVNFESRIDFSGLQANANALRNELSKVIIGQQNIVQMMIVALLSDGHVLLEGVPGVAKTLMANAFAKAIDTDFGRIQFTPDLMPSDVIGTSVYHPEKSNFEFRKGPVFSNIVLIDEINRAPAKTQSALFEVMEERQITYDGVTHRMTEPFMVIATQNPIEQEGTYRLPEAQLDRFLFKLIVDYPSLEEETNILNMHHQRTSFMKPASMVNAIVNASDLMSYKEKMHAVHVEPKLIEYIVNIIAQTRTAKYIYLGASPRASVAVLNASKSLAAISGRDFVTPDDVQAIVPHVLRHRIILTPEREMEGASNDDVIAQLIQKIDVPR